jgi:murein DD-endopeptidase MepM/ murein hydrolase activator NlpD
MKLMTLFLVTVVSFSLHAELSFYSSANHEMDYAPLDYTLSEKEMNACSNIEDNFTILFPLSDKSLPIKSGFNSSPNARTIKGVTEAHWGIDMACKTGTPVYAAHDGIVTAAYEDKQWGNGKHVSMETQDGARGTAYLHLSLISVKQNMLIKAGTKVGEVGNTGFSTGEHLHFSYKVKCPAIGKFVYRDPVGRFSDYPKK